MQGTTQSRKDRQRKKLRLAAIFPILFLMLATTPMVAADTAVYVDAANTTGPWDGTADHPFRNISDATATEATTIYVSAGTYTENVVVTHSQSLIGASALTTIIDGGSHGHTVYAVGTEDAEITFTLSGFTIRHAGMHGFANIACSHVNGGAIEDTTIQDCQEGDGIQLDHCTSLAIHDTIITTSYVSGISLTLCSTCTLDHNTIRYNQKGISISYSVANLITGNTISKNTIYGVYLFQSSQNQFSQNTFSMNGQPASDPCSNAWFISQQGNSWDDYGGVDANHDGIGDTPYPIPGGSNTDNYPLGVFQTAPSQGSDNTPPTVLSMTITPLEAFAGDPVYFSGEGHDTDGIIEGYCWRSNLDGQFSTCKTVTLTTLSVGVHTISFKVQDDDGDWSSLQTGTLTIRANPAAVIDSVSPLTALVHQTVAFQGNAENAEGLDVQYQWTSSQDGALSSEAAFTRSNLTNGVHTISLRIRAQGREWSAPATTLLTIQYPDPDNRTVVADAGGPYHGCIGEPILFNASKSSSSVEENLSYLWDFGDGATGSGRTASHAYATPGQYNVTLTVSASNDVEVSTTQAAVLESGSHMVPSGSSQGSLPLSPLVLGVLGLGVAILATAVGLMLWRRRS